jgi:disulfide bond formation protein DsbB
MVATGRGGYMRAMALALPFARSVDPVRPWLALVLLVSLGALATALIGQFGFGLAPCVLCLYARVPYAMAAAVALLGVVLPLSPAQRRRLLVVAGLAFAGGAGLALYHVGVEEAWWISAIPGCAGRPLGGMSLDDLKAGLLEPLRSCTDVDFRLAGLSLAGWNVIASTALAAGCLGLASRLSGKARP